MKTSVLHIRPGAAHWPITLCGCYACRVARNSCSLQLYFDLLKVFERLERLSQWQRFETSVDPYALAR